MLIYIKIIQEVINIVYTIMCLDDVFHENHICLVKLKLSSSQAAS